MAPWDRHKYFMARSPSEINLPDGGIVSKVTGCAYGVIVRQRIVASCCWDRGATSPRALAITLNTTLAGGHTYMTGGEDAQIALLSATTRNVSGVVLETIRVAMMWGVTIFACPFCLAISSPRCGWRRA